MDTPATALEVLSTESDMVIATADAAGKPWVSPVFFVCDASYGLYWVSSKTAVHSANIRVRPEVGIVVMAAGSAQAVYLDAEARELEDEAAILEAIGLLATKEQPDRFTVGTVDDVTGAAAWRIYRATPKAAWARVNATEAGQAVTIRQPVELSPRR